jgi:predicted transcriptional regulator
MKDLYERWEESGILADRLSGIQEMASKRVSQKDIATYLGVTEKTLIKLKKIHPKMNRAFQYADEEMKYKLIDAMYQRAIGMEYEEVQTIIEETSSGTKKRLVKTKKKALPDIGAIKYLLVIKFGRDYNERKDEIEAMLKRLEKGEEVWTNEYRDEEDLGTIRVRKQSKK